MESISFADIWTLLNPAAEMQNRRGACEQLWGTFSPVKQRVLHRHLALMHETGEELTETNPYYFLNNYRVPAPTFLSGQEQDMAWEQNIPLVQVFLPLSKIYKITTREEAELHGLQITRDWKKRTE